MTILEYKISFATPAFLGNAEQQAQWRTPPFKALIRQWWRIARAKDFHYDYKVMLAEEKYLFGTAGESDQVSTCEKKLGRSKVKLRLDRWQLGTQPKIPFGEAVSHKEIKSGKVGANLYLGYGPINNQNPRTAIDAYSQDNQESAVLRIMVPAEFESEIRSAIQLAAWFGTMGSRSRNAWGSVIIEDLDNQNIKGFADINIDSVETTVFPLPLDTCLELDWPHALGSDDKRVPLVWRLLKVDMEQKKRVSFASWQDAMHELASIKIAIRTSEYFEFKNGSKDGHAIPQPRHILAYPAGSNHNVRQWGNNARLANQLRFKVHRHGSGYAGLIFHFPCGLPSHMLFPFEGRTPSQREVWREVHRLLDSKRGLVRIKGAQK